MEQPSKTKEFNLPDFLRSFTEEDCTDLLNRVVDDQTSFFNRLIKQETELTSSDIFLTSAIISERADAKSEKHIRFDNLLVICFQADEDTYDIPAFTKGIIPVVVKGKYNYTDYEGYDQLRVIQATGKETGAQIFYFAFVHFTYERYIH